MEPRTLSMIIVSAVLAILSFVATVLRLVARSKSRMRYGLDDYLIVAGLVLAWGVCICNIIGAVVARVGTSTGLGTEGPFKGHPTNGLAIKFGKYFYALQILHTCAMPVIKASVLAFYRRIFSTSHALKITIRVLGVLLGAWWFSVIAVTVFQCWPIQNNWGTTAAEFATCMPNENIFYDVSSLTNVLTDAAILFAPIPVVLRLRMNNEHKLAVIGLLLTGSLVIVAGVARTVYLFINPDIFNYQDNFSFLLWTSIEPTSAVISACLPTLRPLLGDLSRITKPLSRIKLNTLFSTSHPAFAYGTNNTTVKETSPLSPSNVVSRFDWSLGNSNRKRSKTFSFGGRYNPEIGRSKSGARGLKRLSDKRLRSAVPKVPAIWEPKQQSHPPLRPGKQATDWAPQNLSLPLSKATTTTTITATRSRDPSPAPSAASSQAPLLPALGVAPVSGAKQYMRVPSSSRSPSASPFTSRSPSPEKRPRNAQTCRNPRSAFSPPPPPPLELHPAFRSRATDEAGARGPALVPDSCGLRKEKEDRYNNYEGDVEERKRAEGNQTKARGKKKRLPDWRDAQRPSFSHAPPHREGWYGDGYRDGYEGKRHRHEKGYPPLSFIGSTGAPRTEEIDVVEGWRHA